MDNNYFFNHLLYFKKIFFSIRLSIQNLIIIEYSMIELWKRFLNYTET